MKRTLLISFVLAAAVVGCKRNPSTTGSAAAGGACAQYVACCNGVMAMPNMASMAATCASAQSFAAMGANGEVACTQGMMSLRAIPGAPAVCGGAGGTMPMAQPMMPQMPGQMPQMPGQMPQMPGQMPQMPGQMPQMPQGMPGQANAPSMPVGMMPSMPGASNYGVVSLAPGFMPDPAQRPVTSGGSIAASTLNPQCRGFVTSQPDLFLDLAGPSNFLRIYVTSQADTTLVVRRPDGSLLCNDDTYGLNPAIEGPMMPGRYGVWVGSYTAGQNAQTTVSFTELQSNHP